MHMLLADLACEDENFEAALPDYERALDLLNAPKEVLPCRGRQLVG